ncbi:MAG TPA: ROK family protein, partial [Anaerolineales bacterium]|nr:ROK family protein [Anaerolineales bacterium]
LDPHGPVCLCGKRGCVERLASGPYLAQDARQALSQEPDQGPELLRLCGGFYDQITAEMLSRAARQGDPLASRLLARSAWAIGTAIGNAANLLNPQRAILGGGVTKAGRAWWQGVRSAARQTMLPEVSIEIVPAKLGDDAPLWGAAVLALECVANERR